MTTNGAGSQRIVLLGEPRPARELTERPAAPRPVDQRPLPGRPDRRVAREAHPTGAAPAQKTTMGARQQNGWTIRRLTGAALLGAVAALAGSVVFLSRFGVFGAADSPFLAVGFGLFVTGMVVFCAALIALLGIGVGVVAEQRGWTAAAIAVFAPLALCWLLYLAGVVGYAIPAVVSLVLIGGLIAALK